DFPAHWTNVRAQLAAVMDAIEEGEPHEAADRIPEDDLLFSSGQPTWAVPGGVIKSVQLFEKSVMMTLVCSDHLFERRRAGCWMKPQSAVVRSTACRAEVHTTAFKCNQQCDQFACRP